MEIENKWSIHTYPFLILEAHLDSYGHMNNVAYLQAFEEARWQMITERNYGLEKVRELQVGPVLLGIDVQFRKEVLLRQKVVIQSHTLSYEGKICKIQQKMLSPSGEIHCQATITMGMFDMRARKLILPSKEWLIACGLREG
jgi:thioesterase-3